ncbi:MAG TPA: hypothetical protein VMP67_10575 [Candidatus Limnocylindria bacterium]|nr:hypothetical protein [Candidatus Limnocylindria bacterium]
MTTALGPSVGAELLSRLGFLHVPGRPFDEGRAYLFVALRRRPTLRHYDPERIDFWRFEEGRGVPAEIDFACPLAPAGGHAWGPIRVTDRLRAVNDFVSFGGELSVERRDGMRVVVFSSAAPILARGGHSQGWDAGAEETAGFMAALRAAVGRSSVIEQRVSLLAPLAVYAAFLATTLARYRAADRLLSWRPDTLGNLRREAARLRLDAPDEWLAGVELAEGLSQRRTSRVA